MPTEVGLTINWGRSAIDTRRASGPDEQIVLARQVGVLAGLMFSGAPGADGRFGPTWTDSHAALHDDPTVGVLTSLLTTALVHSARPGRRRTDLRGLKIGVRSRDLPLEDRLAVVSRLLRAMQG